MKKPSLSHRLVHCSVTYMPVYPFIPDFFVTAEQKTFSFTIRKRLILSVLNFGINNVCSIHAKVDEDLLKSCIQAVLISI